MDRGIAAVAGAPTPTRHIREAAPTAQAPEALLDVTVLDVGKQPVQPVAEVLVDGLRIPEGLTGGLATACAASSRG